MHDFVYDVFLLTRTPRQLRRETPAMTTSARSSPPCARVPGALPHVPLAHRKVMSRHPTVPKRA